MAISTLIEWCDSTLNLQAGCDGCELWNEKAGLRHCYAGTLTERYAGAKGWPVSFDQPALFPERLKAALKWSDLTGTAREAKSWLNGLPRLIFLNDMGDTFTESLPIDWLAPHLPAMADSPHVWMILTKRPKRMRQFFAKHPCPANVWLYVSVTDQSTADARIRELLRIPGDIVRGISAEPLLGAVDCSRWLDPLGMECADVCPRRHYVKSSEVETRVRGEERYPLCPDCGAAAQWTGYDIGLSHVIAGGESGPGARPSHPDWYRSLRDQCAAAGVPYFFKQWGEHIPNSHTTARREFHAKRTPDGDGWRVAVNPGFGGTPWGTVTRSGEWFPSTTPWNGHDDDGCGDREAVMYRVGKKAAGRTLDGKEWNGMPGGAR